MSSDPAFDKKQEIRARIKEYVESDIHYDAHSIGSPYSRLIQELTEEYQSHNYQYPKKSARKFVKSNWTAFSLNITQRRTKRKNKIKSIHEPKAKKQKINQNGNYNAQNINYHTQNIEKTQIKEIKIDIHLLLSQFDDIHGNEHENTLFGYNKEILNNIYKKRNREDLCLNCDDRLTKFDGKMCCIKHCLHPQNKNGNTTAWHNRCLICIDYNKYTICHVCAYILCCKRFQFVQSNNKFINKVDDALIYNALSEAIPVAHFVINGERKIFFVGKVYGENGKYCEYYFIHSRLYVFLLQTSKDRLHLQSQYIQWLTKYASSSQRDEYNKITKKYYNVIPDPSDNIRYNKLEVQYMKNKCTQNVLGWIAIDGVDCVSSFDENIVDFACKRLWDRHNKTRINKQQEIEKNLQIDGAFYTNNYLSLYSIEMSYKFNTSQLCKQYNEIIEHKQNDFEAYNIPNSWDNNGNDVLYPDVIRMNNKLNKIIHWLSDVEPDLWQFHDIVLQYDGMGAILFYDKNQKKHIDATNLMSLHENNLGNSALWMRNGCVNSPEIIYNPSPTADDPYSFRATDPESDEPKLFCFDLNVGHCKGGGSKHKHLEIRKGTICIGIPPDVCTAVHEAHNISGWTIVTTIRGISPQIKEKSVDVTDITNHIRNIKITNSPTY